MTVVSAVVGLDTLVNMVEHCRKTLKEMTYVNGVNGDEVTIEPDVPAVGFATVTVLSQMESY